MSAKRGHAPPWRVALRAGTTVLAALLGVLLTACAPLAPQPLSPPSPWLRVLGSQAIAPGSLWGGSVFGGISGMDYDAARDTYLLISDDRSAHAAARIYTVRLHYGPQQALQPPQITALHALQDASGRPYAAARQARPGVDVPDPEAVRWLPGATQFVWTSEGDFARGFGPQLRVGHADGRHARSIPLPAAFQPSEGQGPRGNGTLEGLALAPDGTTAWLAMELPWRQDGPPASHTQAGAPVRITAIDLASGRALRQLAYQPERVPHPRRLPFGPERNGVSEILADGPHHLLVLERAYSTGAGFAARLYRIDTRSASDTLALPVLTARNHRSAPKALIADFALLGVAVDNLEGMAWGPALADGTCMLVFVSDDNFNPAQVTQFIAAQYRPPGDGHGRCGTTGARP